MKFVVVKPSRGLRCRLGHEGLPATTTSFGGPLLDHMKLYHPEIYAETVRMNQTNRKSVYGSPKETD